MIWILNALVLGLLAGMLLQEHIGKGALQLVVQSATYNEPGARVRVWGVQVKTAGATR